MNDKNVFLVLKDLLGDMEAEVGGREEMEMSAEIRGRLHEMAEGRVDEKERALLVDELVKNPDWIGVLAEVVKKRRNR
jgi:hypothetical protein